MVLAGLLAEVAPSPPPQPGASFPLFSLSYVPMNDEQQATWEMCAQMAMIVLCSMS